MQRHRHCVEAANGDPRAFVDENGIKPAQPPVVFIDKLRKIYPGRGSAGTKFACKASPHPRSMPCGSPCTMHP